MKKILFGIMAILMLTGCGTTQVENREFPDILTVTSESNFSKEWLNGLQEGNKKIDYNHLKVVLIERGFLEKEAEMAEMLALLKDDKNIPLNAYVVVTENVKELTDAKLEVSLGNYLEQLLEKEDTVKKETYPTVGLLYQEQENRMETLFFPCVSLVEEKPAVTAYEVYKRGTAVGLAETDMALLSFFIGNDMKEYVLQTGENQFIKLSSAKNEIDFEWDRRNNGLLKKQVIVEVDCDAKILPKIQIKNKEEAKWQLETWLEEYMTQKASELLKQGIDVTNSFKKLGQENEWYIYYSQNPEIYESEIEILFDVEIDVIN